MLSPMTNTVAAWALPTVNKAINQRALMSVSLATNVTTASSLLIRAVEKQVQAGSQPLAILKGVDIDIKPGESVAIIGASGSGKSTLLGIMAGLDAPTAGEIHLLGQRIDQLDEDQRAAVRAQGAGFVFQNFQLLPGLTALENVMLALEIRTHEQPRQEATRLLEAVGLGHRMTHYPTQLSGGEQQRVALARAFAGEPQILFADEPTGNLDRDTGAQVEKLLFNMNAERGTTLVLVTHDPQLAQRCQRQLRMTDGQLEELL
jgi:putative ABC transport system ATP-binding protein